MIKNILQLIRWPNLLLLAVIQTLVYYRLLDPHVSVVTWTYFVMLALITILLAAGGYVINDVYDRDIDKVNKPNKLIVGELWSLRKVQLLYIILVGTGAFISILLAWRLGLLQYLFIYFLAVIGLWYYSYSLKCKPIIGNLWVSLFCAGVVGIVALPDIILHHAQHIQPELWYYMMFAFLSTWYREVVKDIEDKEGDQISNCRTAVVRFGIKTGKKMALILGLLLLASLIQWDSVQTDKWIRLGLNVIQGFTIASMALMWWAKNNTYYHHASNVIKGVMVGGTILLLCM